jgi:cytochrome c
MFSYLLLAFAGMAIPRDLPLPLPIPEDALRLLIVPTFLLHILFVNLVVGASLMTVIFEGVGRRRPRYDRLAYLIAETITVNKSVAVVLGIAPLLMMNLLYTSSFYAANALTGHAWALLVPLITVAFLLSYLHKYTWEGWTGRRKPLHLLVGGASALLFLAIPLIFLTNINLMLFPESWSQVSGFFSSLRVGNVFPRYFHFLASSLAVTGLFLVARFGWSGFEAAVHLPEFEKSELLGHFYRWTLYVTLAQFVFGPLLLLTLPTDGLTPGTLLSIGAGVMVAALVLRLMSKEIQARQIRLGWRYAVIVTGFGCTVFAMGYGRHLYREGSLAKFKTQVEARSREFAAVELATHH